MSPFSADIFNISTADKGVEAAIKSRLNRVGYESVSRRIGHVAGVIRKTSGVIRQRAGEPPHFRFHIFRVIWFVRIFVYLI